jgi:hypothetical protein
VNRWGARQGVSMVGYSIVVSGNTVPQGHRASRH